MQSKQVFGVAPATPVFDFLERVVAFVTGAILTLLVSLVAIEVLLRSLFGYSLGFVEEVTGYLVVALTLFGAALAVRANSLFQVHVVFDALPARLKRLLAIVFTVIAIGISVVLAWKTFGLVESSMKRGKFAPTVLRTPLWIPQILLPLGFTVIGLFLVEHVGKLLLPNTLRAPNTLTSSDESHNFDTSQRQGEGK